MNFAISASKRKKCVVPFCLITSAEGHIAFISDNLLALRAEDIPDEVAGKAGGLTIGDHIQVTGDRVGLGFHISESGCNDLIEIVPDWQGFDILADKTDRNVTD